MVNQVSRAPQASSQQDNILDGPVAILWDIEFCPVPCDVRAEDVAGNIRKALQVHPVVQGAVTVFSAYGDFNAFSRRLREGCQRTGVKLVDVPSGRKYATDKAILIDMFLFALDNRPPASILLISGDVDFSPALHVLGQRGYTVIVVVPAIGDVESALSSAGRFVWDWPTVARGEGFVPHRIMPDESEPARYDVSCQDGDRSYGQNEDELLVFREIREHKCSVPAEMDPKGIHFLSKYKTPHGLHSNPAEALKFNQKRWKEQSLGVQSPENYKKHGKKLKKKQKQYSAPAKINPNFCYKYDPVCKIFDGTGTHSFAECNGSHSLPSNSNKVPLVDKWEHALPMHSLGIDRKLSKKMKIKRNEFGIPTKIDTTCHSGHSPISKELNGTTHFSSKYNLLQTPSEPSDIPLVENVLLQDELCGQTLNIDEKHKKRRRKKKLKQSEYNEPASPVFHFKYRQVPVEFN
uniref:Limkain-b1 n=1 Tax=Anthurium amnicola TaxID=1678845 RepID=A0A1D1YQ19_9ARAE